MKILDKLKKASDAFEYLTSSRVRVFFLGVILSGGIGYLIYNIQEARKKDLKAIIDFKDSIIKDDKRVISNKNGILTDCQVNLKAKEEEIRNMLSSKEEDCHKLVGRSITLVNDLSVSLRDNIKVSEQFEQKLKNKHQRKRKSYGE